MVNWKIVSFKRAKPLNQLSAINNQQLNQKTPKTVNGFEGQVRMEGLEPPRLAAPDPKSGAATNYATSAKGLQK